MDEVILCQSGIYAITNTANGKKYIGSAVNIRKRWRAHRSALNLGRHHSDKLQNSWRKNGSQCFTFDVIELVNVAALLDREQFWINHFEASSPRGYNVSPTAGNCLGVKQTDDTRAARSLALTGRPRPDDVKLRISTTKRQKSDEEKALIGSRVASALLARTAEAKAESAARAVETKRANGTLKSKPEAIAKQSAAIRGRKLSPEAIAKRSATVMANALKRRESGETRMYVRKK
jgi:group I intron endonuclease